MVLVFRLGWHHLELNGEVMKQFCARLLAVTFAVLASTVPSSPAEAISNSIVINEVDCHGNDWIEIGNRSSNSIDISDWLLSDKALNSTAAGHVYTFPSGTRIAARGRFVVQQSGTGAAHLGFGINCIKGATIKIGYRNGSTYSEIDSVNVPVIAPQISYGRLPDLTGGFEQTAATKNAANYGIKPILTSATTATCIKGRVCKVTLRAHNAPTFRLSKPVAGVSVTADGVLSVITSKIATYKPVVVMTNRFGSTNVTVSIAVKLR